MISRPTVDYEIAKKLILFRLHLALVKFENINTEIGMLGTKVGVPTQLSNICAQRLVQRSFVDIESVSSLMEHPQTGDLVDYEEKRLSITEEGIKEVEGWSDDSYQAIAYRALLSPDDTEDEVNQKLEDNMLSSLRGIAPAADRFVLKSDNEDVWNEAKASLNDVINALESEKSLDNELGSEKPAVLNALKSARALFDDTKMKIDIAVALMVEPLKVLAVRYEQTAAGAVLTTALAVIAKFLGLL